MKRAQHNSEQRAAEHTMLHALADCAEQIGFTKVETILINIHGQLSIWYGKIRLIINLSDIDGISDHDVISFQVNITADSTNRDNRDIEHTSYLMLKTIKYRFFLHGSNKKDILIGDFKKTYVIPYLNSIYSIVKGFSTMHLQKEHTEDIDTTIQMLNDCAIELGFDPTMKDKSLSFRPSINILIGSIVFTIAVFIDKRKLPSFNEEENVIILDHTCFVHCQEITCIDFSYNYSLGDSEVILPEMTEFHIKLYLCELYAWAVGMILSSTLLSDIEHKAS